MAAATQPKPMGDSNLNNAHNSKRTEQGTSWKENLDLPQKDHRIKTAVS